ncbi:hypothetical protein BSKO_09429 [Bryopsis sp. KO-2023]|nr:hypothetical protein BSKO_09429 [Bryopsis sp. KO-2023]
MDARAASVDLVRQLIHVLCRDAPDDPDARQRLLSLALQIMGCNVSLALVEDESAVCDSMRATIRSAARPGASTRFDELHTKLVQTVKDSNKRARILLLLTMIGRDKQRSRPGTGVRGAWSGNEGNLGILHSALENNAGIHANGGVPPPRGNSRNSNRAKDDNRNRSNQALGMPRGRDPAVQRSTGVSEAKEPLLVRDILYICQGIDGTYIKFKRNLVSGCEEFSISKEAGVRPVTKKLILQLCELGWLFQRVQVFVQSRSVYEGGSVRQAFCYAVNKELRDYYRLMAVLETQSVQPLPTAFPSQKSSQTDGGEMLTTESTENRSSSNAPYLSLRRLAVWLAEPMRRMRILAFIIDQTEKQHGGELAGGIYARTQTGDPFAKEFVMRILRRVSVPLFKMIKRWVFEGELADTNGEFFIKEAKLKKAEDREVDMWREGYSINIAMLPAFVSPTLADKILRAGKSINFLREYCGDMEWVQEQAAAAQDSADESMTYGHMESLQQLVDEASSLVDQRLIEIMFKKFHFVVHCTAVKRFLLLGQGDFVQSLMDFIKPELDKDSVKVSEIQLAGHLRAAIHASSAKYDDDEVLDRLHARKSKGFGLQRGWDVFSLEYRVNQPLSTVFTPKNMSSYLRVFRLLWKLKHAEQTLNKVWHSLQCMDGSLNRLPIGGSGELARKLLRHAFMIRSKLSHFCTNFQYYIMFEVLEGAWRSFTLQATSATDLDKLLHAHECYLATIVTRCLLDEDTQTLRDTLEKMFETVEKMIGLVNRLDSEISTVMTKHRSQVMQQRRGMEENAWGGSQHGKNEEIDLDIVQYNSVKEVIDDLLRTYEFSIGQFTRDLPPQAHVDLRFLIFRLDFAELYMRKEQDGAEEEFDGEDTFRG